VLGAMPPQVIAQKPCRRQVMRNCHFVNLSVSSWLEYRYFA
jgi:hypothetical protein